MNKIAQKIWPLVFGLAGLWIILSSSAFSQEESLPAEQPVIFNEIMLDQEGVIAIDDSGQRWRYDFATELFVKAASFSESSGRRLEDSRSDGSDEASVEERCTEELQVSKGQKRVIVESDQFVDGDILAYGRVTVKGWVKGDVKSISQRVLVTRSGRVDGDIIAPNIIVKDGGMLIGEAIETGNPLDLSYLRDEFNFDGIWVVFGLTLFVLFIAFIETSLMPRQLKNIKTCLTENKTKSILLGFLLTFAIGPAMGLLAITIIGIVVVPIVPLAYIVAYTLGIVIVGMIIAQKTLGRFIDYKGDPIVTSIIGSLLFMGVWFLVASLLGSSDSEMYGIGLFLLVVSIIVTSFTIMAGLGAVFLTRFGFRPYSSIITPRQNGAAASAPAPPPIPNHNHPTPPSAPGSRPPSGDI